MPFIECTVGLGRARLRPSVLGSFYHLGLCSSSSFLFVCLHQKKITERHREIGITERLFEGMTEITDLIEHRGSIDRLSSAMNVVGLLFGCLPSTCSVYLCALTDGLTTHIGHHGNRGEMGQVRSWIEERGVGSEVLGKVLNLG